jgi:hypothetical protein
LQVYIIAGNVPLKDAIEVIDTETFTLSVLKYPNGTNVTIPSVTITQISTSEIWEKAWLPTFFVT